MRDLSMTIKRADLLTVIQDRRATVETEWDEEIARLTAARDNIPKAADALTAWYAAVGAMIAAGEARSNSRGEIVATNPDAKEVPEKPAATSNRSEKEQLGYAIKNAEQEKAAMLARLDAAIRLLGLATDDEVTVPVSEYEGLLSTGVRTSHRYF